jgi:hypothetical protein
MASPFSSALAKLNDSLHAIEAEVYRLRKDPEADDAPLRLSLEDACHYAAELSNLLCAERLKVNGNDRIALDHSVYELDIVVRNQRRRIRLLDLKKELDRGRIQHHRNARITALDALRLEAVKELQEQATLADPDKDLPGPVASQWVHWTCSLGEDRDSDILLSLRRDFPAVERFIAAMEEDYWKPGEQQNAAEPLQAFAGAAPETVAEPAPVYSGQMPVVVVDPDRLARNLIALFEKITPGAGVAELNPLAHEHRVTDVASSPTGGARNFPGLQTTAPIRIDKQRVDRRAIADFFKVVGSWELSNREARALVGVSDRMLRQLQRGEKSALKADKLTRMSLVVGISNGLKVLYGRSRADKWVHAPNSNPMFNGDIPLKYMLKGGVDALVRVRELVGVWASYAPTRK